MLKPPRILTEREKLRRKQWEKGSQALLNKRAWFIMDMNAAPPLSAK